MNSVTVARVLLGPPDHPVEGHHVGVVQRAQEVHASRQKSATWTRTCNPRNNQDVPKTPKRKKILKP